MVFGSRFALWNNAFPVSYIIPIVVKAVDMIVFVDQFVTASRSEHSMSHYLYLSLWSKWDMLVLFKNVSLLCLSCSTCLAKVSLMLGWSHLPANP